MIEKQSELKGDFGSAIKALKNGYKVAREGWNGKGMWLFYQKEQQGLYKDQVYTMYHYIIMKTVDNKLIPWLASQTDMLAEDWTVVE